MTEGKAGKAASTKLAERTSEPTALSGYEAEAGIGFEETSSQDYVVPLLKVLQALSPELDETSGAFVQGAKRGQIINSVTKETFDKVVVVPVHRSHSFVEWVPRDAGGGLVAVHEPGSKLVRDATKGWRGFGKVELPNGNELVETNSMFCLMLRSDGRTEPCVINFSSTQLKGYKLWMTRARSLTFRTADGSDVPFPIFAHRYQLSTQKQKNKKGEWSGWTAQLDGATAEASRLAQDDGIYQAAKSFRTLATSGQLKVDQSSMEAEDDLADEGVNANDGQTV